VLYKKIYTQVTPRRNSTPNAISCLHSVLAAIVELKFNPSFFIRHKFDDLTSLVCFAFSPEQQPLSAISRFRSADNALAIAGPFFSPILLRAAPDWFLHLEAGLSSEEDVLSTRRASHCQSLH
jgi:hypothetical protein